MADLKEDLEKLHKLQALNSMFYSNLVYICTHQNYFKCSLQKFVRQWKCFITFIFSTKFNVIRRKVYKSFFKNQDRERTLKLKAKP